MSKTAKIVLLVVGILVLLGLIIGSWIWGGYNTLVSTQEGVKNEWANVETQYQRRMDLIPNVVNTVKGSANFEQETLTAVVEARSAWATAKNNGDINGEIEAANSFDSALARLLVTVEAYPDIKSTEAFRDLITELEGTENRIAIARRDFNESVKPYNLKIRQFPSSVIAGMFGFDEWEYFTSQEGADVAPVVNFE